MKMNYFGKAELKSETGGDCELSYYLTSKDGEDGEVFGVLVEKCENGGITEKDMVDNLSCDRESALHVLDKLCSNIVTPVSLAEVLDDLTE